MMTLRQCTLWTWLSWCWCCRLLHEDANKQCLHINWLWRRWHSSSSYGRSMMMMVTARIMMMTILEDDDNDNFAGHHSLRSDNCKSLSLRSFCELHCPIIIQSSSKHHPTLHEYQFHHLILMIIALAGRFLHSNIQLLIGHTISVSISW